jgi:DNA-binding MarR family transcriptional regulator
MAPSRQAVQSMVAALFTLIAGLERARQQKQAAATLSLLQVIASNDGIRPSDIADLQLAHRSRVTRQVQELENAGYVQVTGDPVDGRSWLVALTSAGREEMERLQQAGLDRFTLFVADWDEADVRTLGTLLDRLRVSIATAAERDQDHTANDPGGRSDHRQRRHARRRYERQP